MNTSHPHLPANQRRTRSLLFLLCFFAGSCTVSRKMVWINPQTPVTRNLSKRIVYLPPPSIDTVCIDHTGTTPPEQVDHQLLIDATNAALISEIARRFRLITGKETDSTDRDHPRFSRLLKEGDSAATAEFIALRAKQSGAHLVAIAHHCSVTTTAFQARAWRDGKYEGYYERPVTRLVHARVHLQIWTEDGSLAYEKVGAATAKAPVLYDRLRSKQREGVDLVRYARKWYAPPALKATLAAVRDAMAGIR